MSKQIVLFNPFTGTPRDPRDIQTDPFGLAIWDGETPLAACRASALEECAQRFEQVGGMIDPRAIAAALRTLKDQP